MNKDSIKRILKTKKIRVQSGSRRVSKSTFDKKKNESKLLLALKKMAISTEATHMLETFLGKQLSVTQSNTRGNVKNKFAISANSMMLTMREYKPIVLDTSVCARLVEWDENNNAIEKARPHTWLTAKDCASPLRGSTAYGENYIVKTIIDNLEASVGKLCLIHTDPNINGQGSAGSFIFGNEASTFFIEMSAIKYVDMTSIDSEIVTKLDETQRNCENIIVSGYITFYISALSTTAIQIEEITKIIEDAAADANKESVMINMITHNANMGYRVRSMPMNHWPTLDNNDIKLHYGDSFLEFSTALVKKVKETSKGIVMLHGPPGTGKTYYIRRLTTALTRAGKQVFMIPKGVVDMIQDPSFVDFMINHFASGADNDEKKEGIVFIIEDAESLLVKRNTDSHAAVGVSTLLNLTDGILNDLFNVQIIATFNTAIDNLDEALLRKGRLLAIRELGLLDINEAKRLSQHLHNNSNNVSKEMTLSEVYSLGASEEETILTQNKPVQKIRKTGFM